MLNLFASTGATEPSTCLSSTSAGQSRRASVAKRASSAVRSTAKRSATRSSLACQPGCAGSRSLPSRFTTGPPRSRRGRESTWCPMPGRRAVPTRIGEPSGPPGRRFAYVSRRHVHRAQRAAHPADSALRPWARQVEPFALRRSRGSSVRSKGCFGVPRDCLRPLRAERPPSRRLVVAHSRTGSPGRPCSDHGRESTWCPMPGRRAVPVSRKASP